MNNLVSKKQKLVDLLDRKISLIEKLLSTNDKISATNVLEDENYISRFSINSLHDLYRLANNQMSVSLNTKSDLKKSCLKILDELDSLDTSIFNSTIELMIEKINTTTCINVQ